MTPERILIVDDQRAITRLIERVLGARGFDCLTAYDAQGAADALESAGGRVNLMLCDLRMPGRSGLELIQDVRRRYPEVGVIMISGVGDADVAEKALELGAYGYVVKPFSASQLVINVASALRQQRLETENRAHRLELEERVASRTAELRAAGEKLRGSYEETVRRLSRAVEFRDHDTAGHIDRVSLHSESIARCLGLESERCELIRAAAPMHDAGKIAVPDSILLKPGPLTLPERTTMEEHAEIGYQLLRGSESELLELAATIAWTHHERFDGHGYPRGLSGQEIPIEGRIVAIADVFDALTTDRPYRDAYPVEHALELVAAERGKHFDPALADAFASATLAAPAGGT